MVVKTLFFIIYWQRIKYRVFHYGDIGSGCEKIREGKKIYFNNLKNAKLADFWSHSILDIWEGLHHFQFYLFFVDILYKKC